MLLKVFIEKDLGHVSYIFADDISKECIVLDPRRDIDEYINFIEENDLKLKYIFNTHTHADYIGGHLELVSKYSSAKNIFHKNVPANFDFIKVQENDIFQLGKNIKLTIIETPGHTPFCLSCLVSEDGIDKYIFTGDILFVGDIARPDLLGEEVLENLLDMSYNTANKLWNLSDDLIVFTSHIKGSFCGKNLKSQYFSTIGIEKKTNISFSLCKNSKEEYISNLLNQNLETPSFFKKMAGINIDGPRLLDTLSKPKLLKENDFFKNYNPEEDFIVDFRHPNCFKNGYIAGSINVYEYSNIIIIAGSLIDIDSKLYLVGDKKTNFNEIIKKLRRIGFDNIEAVLKADVNELRDLVVFKDFESNSSEKKIINLDTTKEIADINIEISQINTLKFDQSINYDVICQNGYKSMAVKTFLLKLKNQE